MLLPLSCQTVKPSPLPSLDWPVWPDPSIATYDDTTKSVTIPLDFWLELAQYKAAIDRNKQILGY